MVVNVLSHQPVAHAMESELAKRKALRKSRLRARLMAMESVPIQKLEIIAFLMWLVGFIGLGGIGISMWISDQSLEEIKASGPGILLFVIFASLYGIGFLVLEPLIVLFGMLKRNLHKKLSKLEEQK